jgi:hypothetical protein
MVSHKAGGCTTKSWSCPDCGGGGNGGDENGTGPILANWEACIRHCLCHKFTSISGNSGASRRTIGGFQTKTLRYTLLPFWGAERTPATDAVAKSDSNSFWLSARLTRSTPFSFPLSWSRWIFLQVFKGHPLECTSAARVVQRTLTEQAPSDLFRMFAVPHRVKRLLMHVAQEYLESRNRIECAGATAKDIAVPLHEHQFKGLVATSVN